MKPINFKEANLVLKSDRKSYNNKKILGIEVFSNENEVISCWKLDIKDILRIIFTKKIWLGQENKHNPCWLDTKKPFIKNLNKYKGKK